MKRENTFNLAKSKDLCPRLGLYCAVKVIAADR